MHSRHRGQPTLKLRGNRNKRAVSFNRENARFATLNRRIVTVTVHKRIAQTQSIPNMETKRSRDFDGKNRILAKKECAICKKEFWIPKHRFNRSSFCSLDCRNKGHSNKQKYNCAQCNKELLRSPSKTRQSKSGLFFCNRECKELAQSIGGIKEIQPDHYGETHYSYRVKAFKHYEAKCCKCGYDEKKKMLDVDHIDSNRKNNELDNLQVLCVWCHAEKTRADWPE